MVVATLAVAMLTLAFTVEIAPLTCISPFSTGIDMLVVPYAKLPIACTPVPKVLTSMMSVDSGVLVNVISVPDTV